jgi:hypothetical protein
LRQLPGHLALALDVRVAKKRCCQRVLAWLGKGVVYGHGEMVNEKIKIEKYF